MKNYILFISIGCCQLLSAQDPKQIFNAEKIVFYGLDFSKAKLAISDVPAAEIKKTFFPQWNDVVMTDNERFNKESAFEKLSFYGDPSITEKRNAAVNVSNIVGKTDGHLSPETIKQVISEYKDGIKKEGLGVVLIVESFDKKQELAVAHVVFFDIATLKVLLAKRLSGQPGGGGLKNYWARAISLMFQKMIDKEFALWKKEVMGG